MVSRAVLPFICLLLAVPTQAFVLSPSRTTSASSGIIAINKNHPHQHSSQIPLWHEKSALQKVFHPQIQPPRSNHVHLGASSIIVDAIKPLFANSGSIPLIQSFLLNVFLFSAASSKLFKMLTPNGFANALVLATGLWSSLGWRGWLVCVSYLFLGQVVTKVKFAEKEKRGIAEKRGGRRGPENVWGSAATGLALAICSAQPLVTSRLGISARLFHLGYVASLATKLADTFASEIGKAYGKTTFLITTLERVEPGTEGAISAEGTAAAALGGLLLSLCGYGLGFLNVPGVILSTVAAFIATNVESLLGATLQEKEGLKWMTNEVVNFINTLIGAAIAMTAGAAIL